MTTSSGNDQPKSDSRGPKRVSHATERVHDYDDDDAFDGDPDERGDAGIEALSQSLVPGHFVVERSAIMAALDATGFDGGYEHLSNGEEQRVRMLVRYRRSVLFRRHLIGSPAMLARLENLDTTAPNFAAVTRLVRRAALVSQLAGTPIRVQPLCLVGSPGIGKSRYARLLADALGTSCDIVNGSTLPDVGSLTGYPPVWRGSGPGRLAKFLLSARTSGPLILVDECEKIVDYEAMAHPLDRLLPILEHDTARTYQDENLQVPMAAHHATLLFACNSLEALSAPFRDRVAIIRIPDLDAAQRDGVLETMLADVAEHLGVPMALAGREALAPLRGLSPRRCRLAFEIATGIAVDRQRRFVTAADLTEAVTLLSGSDQRSTFGFFPASGAELD